MAIPDQFRVDLIIGKCYDHSSTGCSYFYSLCLPGIFITTLHMTNSTSYSLLVRNLIRTCFRYLKLTSSSSVVIRWLVTGCWCCFCWRCLLELGVSTAAGMKESDSVVPVPCTLWVGSLNSCCSVFFMSLSLCCKTRIFCKASTYIHEGINL